jgi:hypothetical protein
MYGCYIYAWFYFSSSQNYECATYTSIFPMPWVLIVGLSLLTHVWWMANITRRGGSSLSNWEEKDGVIYGSYCGPSMVVDGWRANS